MDVVVESLPRQTINGHLLDYKVPRADTCGTLCPRTSVQPDDNFRMVWTVDPAEKNIRPFRTPFRAEHLYLATDPDREGEAISARRKSSTNAKRWTASTSNASFSTRSPRTPLSRHCPRELNQELIDAYLARRALDYLVGFSLSPVLWRKLPGSRSAGRGSCRAAADLRARSRDRSLQPQEYWTIGAEYTTTEGKVPARPRI